MHTGGADLFLHIGAVVAAAAIFGLLARLIKFPPLVGYVFAGLLIGPLAAGTVADKHLLETIKHASFASLLFFVGLELNLFKLREQITSALSLALVQIVGSFSLGFAFGYVLELPPSGSIILGLALSFTSGVSVLKLLSDSGETNSIHGRFATNLLLIQDILASIALVVLVGLGTSTLLTTTSHALLLTIEAVALIIITWYCARFVLPWLFSSVARNSELLAICSLGWFFLFTYATSYLSIPTEVGALLAGISLAGLPYTSETTARLRTVRDLTIVFLFVTLGSTLGTVRADTAWIIATLTACVVIVRPLISMVTLAFHGLRTRTAFLAGITQGQLSEFSLLFLAVGAANGLISTEVGMQISWVVVLSIIITSVLHAFRKPIFAVIGKFIRLFERGHHIHRSLIQGDHRPPRDHAILIGYHRTGYHILRQLRAQKVDTLVIEMDPDIVHTLREEGVACLYGDIEDEHLLLEHGNLSQARLVVSTLPHKSENLYLLSTVQRHSKKCRVIVTARNIHDALTYYEHGADYVLLPHLIGSEQIGKLIRDARNNPDRFHREAEERPKLEQTLADALYYE